MRNKRGDTTSGEPVEMSGAVLILPGAPAPEARMAAFTPVTPVLVTAGGGAPLAALPAPTGAPIAPATAAVTPAAPEAPGYVPQHRASRRGGGSRSRLAVLALGTIALGGGAYYYLTAILPTMTG